MRYKYILLTLLVCNSLHAMEHDSHTPAPKPALTAAEPEMCSICQDFNLDAPENQANVYTCPHTHRFCRECITAWCNRSASCPVCRAPLRDYITWRYRLTHFSERTRLILWMLLAITLDQLITRLARQYENNDFLQLLARRGVLYYVCMAIANRNGNLRW